MAGRSTFSGKMALASHAAPEAIAHFWRIPRRLESGPRSGVDSARGTLRSAQHALPTRAAFQYRPDSRRMSRAAVWLLASLSRSDLFLPGGRNEALSFYLRGGVEIVRSGRFRGTLCRRHSRICRGGAENRVGCY